ncbi:MAG: hypothetical protein ACK45C_06100, partial [Bacteroidota bacterium]
MFVKTKSSRFHVSHVQERYLEAANELLRTLSEENPVGLSKWFSRENGKQQETQHKKLSMIALDDFRGGLPSYESLEESEGLDAQGGTETVDLGLGDGYGVAILG